MKFSRKRNSGPYVLAKGSCTSGPENLKRVSRTYGNSDPASAGVLVLDAECRGCVQLLCRLLFDCRRRLLGGRRRGGKSEEIAGVQQT